MSVYPFQFHVDNISAPDSYFSFWCCWGLNNHHVLYRCLFFLFRLFSLRLWTFLFLCFPRFIRIFLDRNSITFVICFRLFYRVYFVFFVASISSFLFRWFHELSSVVFDSVELEITRFSLFALSYQPSLNPRYKKSTLSMNWLLVRLITIPVTIIVTLH